MRVKGILGQAAPAATTETDLYTVPEKKSATVKVVAANRGNETTIRINCAPGGVATATDQYLVYDKTLPASDALVTSSFMIGASDVLRVYAGSSGVSFTCTGIED